MYLCMYPLSYISDLNASSMKCTYLSFVLNGFHDILISNTISISDGVRVAYKLETFMIPTG